MPLASDIAALRDRILADLDAAHDYFFTTKTAWQMATNTIDAGKRCPS